MPNSLAFLFCLIVVYFCIPNYAVVVVADKPVKAEAANIAIIQQDFDHAPPFPILSVGLQHIISELIANGTDVAVGSVITDKQNVSSSIEAGILNSIAPVQCGTNSPCTDGSCCNSQGQCGFADYHCKTTGVSSCISNCGAKAMCGQYSINGQQSCPLGLCCSFSGYCGSSELYCDNLDSITHLKPCQEGFGNCRVVPPPSCGNAVSVTPTASNGRRVAYYQANNLRYRKCNRIAPKQINTTGLTHLLFAFASIDPITFKVVPTDLIDIPLYSQFTALKTERLETWIAVGGFTFNDPGPTHTTWSSLCATFSNRATFIQSMVEFMEKWGFQGIDIDWEFPGVPDRGGKEVDRWNLVLLVREMRAVFGSKYGISIALPNDFYYLERFDPVAMEPWLTFINFMTYDMHGPWEVNRFGAKIRPQTSIADIKEVSVPLWFAGVSPPKINLGMAYYARGYTVSDPKCADIGCSYVSESRPGRCTGSPGVLSLTEIQELIRQKSLIPKLIPDAIIKQITFGDQWIGYDDDETIRLKTKWADQHCFGGVAIWSIDFNSGTGSDSVSSQQTVSFPTLAASKTATSASTSAAQSHASMTISKDGTCGSGKNCAGSDFGNCCSYYGFCGSTEAYCMAGCQPAFGSCVSTTNTQSNVSISGICGGFQNVLCTGSKFGDCCSRYGFCGSTDDYCDSGKGCQCKFGTCR